MNESTATAQATAYLKKSLAEQNSVAWDLLLSDDFRALHQAIYTTPEEYQHFRQIVVNSVIATDIMDKDQFTARSSAGNM